MVCVADYLFWQLIVQQGLVPGPSVEACAAEQARYQQAGYSTSLAEVLQARGLLDAAQARQYVDHVAKLIFECQRCRAPVQVAQIAAATQMACPYCGSGLDPSMLRGSSSGSSGGNPVFQPGDSNNGSQSGPFMSPVGSPFDSARPAGASPGAVPPGPAGPGKTQIVYSSQNRASGLQDPRADGRLDTEAMRSNLRPSTKKIVGSSGLISELDGRRSVGAYEVLDELGRGAMGVVYKVRHPQNGQIAALKLLIAGQLASETQVERFIREAEITARLDHPNIVPIRDVGAIDGHPFFTMEFIEGKPLSYHIKRRKLGLRKSVLIARDIARALHYAHTRKIIHRDIKPANILIDGQGNPRVTDFGLARELEDESKRLTRTGAVLGTPYYMAPEQIEGSKNVSVEADVYALGVVLYEMLTFRLPFKAQSQIDLSRMILKDPPPRPSSLEPAIDRKLDAICLKSLAKKPRDRYSSAADMAADLDAYLAGEPIIAREPMIGASGGKIALVVLGIAATLSGLALAFMTPSLSPPPPGPVPPPPVVGPPIAVIPPNGERIAMLLQEARDAFKEARTTIDPALFIPGIRRTIDKLDKVLELDPSEPEALMLRGEAYAVIDEDEKARADLAKLPENARARYMLVRNQHVDTEEEDGEGANKGLQQTATAMRAIQQLEGPTVYKELAACFVLAFADNEPELAVRRLEDLLPRASEAVSDIQLIRGFIYLQVNRNDEARRCFDAVLQSFPNQSSALGNRAQILLQTGEIADALRDAERLSKVAPNNANGPALMGNIYLIRKEYSLALRALARLLELKPKDAEARLAYAQVLGRENQLQSAVKECEQVIKERPKLVKAYLLLADLFLEFGRGDDHDRVLMDAAISLEERSQRRIVFEKLTDRLRERGRFNEVVAACERLQSRDPNDDMPYVILGTILLQAGRTEEGIAKLEQAVRVGPSSLPAHVALIDAMMKTGRAPREIDLELNRIIELGQKSPEAISVAAKIELGLGRATQALKTLRSGLVTHPKNPALMMALAELLFVSGSEQEAETLISQVLSIPDLSRRNQSKAICMLARAHAVKDNLTQALPLVERALAADGSNVEAIGLQTRLYFQLEKYDLALKVGAAAVQRGLAAGDVHEILGRLEARRGNPAVAAQHFEQAVKHNSRSAICFYLLATSLADIGQRDRALEAVGVAKKLNKSSPELEREIDRLIAKLRGS